MRLCKWKSGGDVHTYHDTVRRYNGNFWKALCGQDNEGYPTTSEMFEGEEKNVTCWKCKTAMLIKNKTLNSNFLHSIQNIVIRDILERMIVSENKHPGWPERMGDGLCILTEELGEIAKAMLVRRQFVLKEELLDLASATIRFLLYIYEAEERDEKLQI
jgi:NTP pyrophosphatase (non-canonical NTP hydrolase)